MFYQFNWKHILRFTRDLKYIIKTLYFIGTLMMNTVFSLHLSIIIIILNPCGLTNLCIFYVRTASSVLFSLFRQMVHQKIRFYYIVRSIIIYVRKYSYLQLMNIIINSKLSMKRLWQYLYYYDICDQKLLNRQEFSFCLVTFCYTF